MSIPNDPVILLSFINTKLRDEFPSFEDFCKFLGVSASEILAKLGSIGYKYDPERNCFR